MCIARLTPRLVYMAQADGLTIVQMREKPCSTSLFKGIELVTAIDGSSPLAPGAASPTPASAALHVHKSSGKVGDLNFMWEQGIAKSDSGPRKIKTKHKNTSNLRLAVVSRSAIWCQSCAMFGRLG